MEKKLAILKPFFEEPMREFSLRELSRIVGKNHTTVRHHLERFEKEGILSRRKMGVYSFYRLVQSKDTNLLKLFYNLKKLHESGLIEALEAAFDLPVIVLFGSFAQAIDDGKSDIDLCLITNVRKSFSVESFERVLNRRVSLRKFSKKEWRRLIKQNPGLVNSICNGIVLSGELVVLE